MKIKIDQKEMVVTDPTMNIVEIASDNGVTILAPCFRNELKHGGCSVCVIEVDGEKKYACATKPYDNMNIIYDREDLNNLRNERLEYYANNVKNGNVVDNKCWGRNPEDYRKKTADFASNSNGSSCGCGCE